MRFFRDGSLQTPAALGVSSAVRGEGRTTVAISLANALAWETEGQVVLLEGDLENPSLALEMGVDSGPGIAGYLTGEVTNIERTFVSTDVRNLTLIPAGEPEEGHSRSVPDDELIAHLRHRLSDIVETLKEDFDYVVVDLPPLLENIHAERMARQLDGNVFVVRSGTTELAQLDEALDLLGEDLVKGVVHLGNASAMPAWMSRFVSG